MIRWMAISGFCFFSIQAQAAIYQCSGVCSNNPNQFINSVGSDYSNRVQAQQSAMANLSSQCVSPRKLSRIRCTDKAAKFGLMDINFSPANSSADFPSSAFSTRNFDRKPVYRGQGKPAK